MIIIVNCCLQRSIKKIWNLPVWTSFFLPTTASPRPFEDVRWFSTVDLLSTYKPPESRRYQDLNTHFYAICSATSIGRLSARSVTPSIFLRLVSAKPMLVTRIRAHLPITSGVPKAQKTNVMDPDILSTLNDVWKKSLSMRVGEVVWHWKLQALGGIY